MKYSNQTPFFIFLYSEACKEQSISGKYKRKGIFKVNEGGKYKMEGQTNF